MIAFAKSRARSPTSRAPAGSRPTTSPRHFSIGCCHENKNESSIGARPHRARNRRRSAQPHRPLTEPCECAKFVIASVRSPGGFRPFRSDGPRGSWQCDCSDRRVHRPPMLAARRFFPALVFAAFTLVFAYVATTLALAKPFWHDEIYTILFADLPSLGTMWR